MSFELIKIDLPPAAPAGDPQAPATAEPPRDFDMDKDSPDYTPPLKPGRAPDNAPDIYNELDDNGGASGAGGGSTSGTWDGKDLSFYNGYWHGGKPPEDKAAELTGRGYAALANMMVKPWINEFELSGVANPYQGKPDTLINLYFDPKKDVDFTQLKRGKVRGGAYISAEMPTYYIIGFKGTGAIKILLQNRRGNQAAMMETTELMTFAMPDSNFLPNGDLSYKLFIDWLGSLKPNDMPRVRPYCRAYLRYSNMTVRAERVESGKENFAMLQIKQGTTNDNPKYIAEINKDYYKMGFDGVGGVFSREMRDAEFLSQTVQHEIAANKDGIALEEAFACNDLFRMQEDSIDKKLVTWVLQQSYPSMNATNATYIAADFSGFTFEQ